MSAALTVGQVLVDATRRLRQAGVEDPASDGRRLMAHSLGIEPGRLTLHLPDPILDDQKNRFERAVAERVLRKPVSQIVGYRDFYGLRFQVTKDTLDPRPDTETLVAVALEQPFQRVLDLGTGTGCILLSCLANQETATGIGGDVSEAALQVANRNAVQLGLDRRASFRRTHWFSDIDETFDLIVSNPPYIAEDEMASLAPEVRDHEPLIALTPGADGLAAYRIILQDALGHLRDGGRVVLEIGWRQGAEVADLMRAAGLQQVRIIPDLNGHDRVVLGQK